MSPQPQLLLLPKPLAHTNHPIGQLITLSSPSATFTPTTLSDRDYDDTHATSWYKDVILIDSSTQTFLRSLGAAHLVERPAPGTDLAIIEAEKVVVRTLKDASTALRNVCSTQEATAWLEEQRRGGVSVAFVSAVKEAGNASYRWADVEVVGGEEDMVEVHRVLSQGEEGGDVKRGTARRRDSGLDVETGSKVDVLGLELKRVVVVDGRVELGELVDQEEMRRFWGN